MGKKARRNLLSRRALQCRGDWIRTSDLLNPIQEGGSPEMRKVIHFQIVRHSTHSTFYTVSLPKYGFLCKLCNPVRAPLKRTVFGLILPVGLGAVKPNTPADHC